MQTENQVHSGGIDCRATSQEASCGEAVLLKEVIDGDTLRLDGGQLVRLVGIDAPDVHPDTDCLGVEVRDRIRRMILGNPDDEDDPITLGQPVDSVFVQIRPMPGHPDKDGGRLLRRVAVVAVLPTTENPFRVVEIEDLGKWLLAQGMARFDDFALDHYSPRHEVLKGLKGYRQAENRSKGGWVKCGW